MIDVLKLLEKEFEKKALTVFRFVNEGDTIIGRYVDELESIDGEKPRRYIIIEALDGHKYAISRTVNIDRSLNFLNPDKGDYIMIRFDEAANTADGRTFKKFTVAVMKPEEFNAIMEKLKKEVGETGIIQKEAEEKPAKIVKQEELEGTLKKSQRTKKEEEKEVIEKTEEPSKEAKVDQELVAAIDFIKKLMEFYSEMSYDELLKKLKYRGVEASIEDIKQFASEELEFDDDKKIVRLKQ